jgi:hypothetical protein
MSGRRCQPALCERNFRSMLVFHKEMLYIGGMLVTRSIFAACIFALTFCALAESRPLDTYQSIVDRNPFGLKDPPVPVVKETNAAPLAKKEDFYLTGISTIGNPKRPKAYLLAKDASKKDYDQKFYNLTVGDRQGDVTLQEVDPKGRRVKIAYMGEEKWLSMKDNGVPAPTGAPMVNMPGVPGAHVSGPNMVPGGGPAPVPLPLPTGANNPGQAQPVTYPNAMNTGRRPMRTSSRGISSPEAVAAPQSDADVLRQILTMQHQAQTGIITPGVTTPVGSSGAPGGTGGAAPGGANSPITLPPGYQRPPIPAPPMPPIPY